MVQQTGLNELPIQKRIAMNITMQTFHFYKNIFTINVNVQVFIIIIFLFFFFRELFRQFFGSPDQKASYLKVILFFHCQQYIPVYFISVNVKAMLTNTCCIQIKYMAGFTALYLLGKNGVVLHPPSKDQGPCM